MTSDDRPGGGDGRDLPQVLRADTPYDDGWVSLHRDELRFADGSEGRRVWMQLHAPFVCNVVPTLPSGEMVFVEVYRHPVRRWLLELPGGLGEDGEMPAESAARELLEETGLTPGRLEPIGVVNVDPGLIFHDTHVFRAAECTGWNAAHSDPGDQIWRVVSLPPDEVERRVTNGEITHGPTLIALFLAGLDEGR